jgi:hypothetical protein
MSGQMHVPVNGICVVRIIKRMRLQWAGHVTMM